MHLISKTNSLTSYTISRLMELTLILKIHIALLSLLVYFLFFITKLFFIVVLLGIFLLSFTEFLQNYLKYSRLKILIYSLHQFMDG